MEKKESTYLFSFPTIHLYYTIYIFHTVLIDAKDLCDSSGGVALRRAVFRKVWRILYYIVTSYTGNAALLKLV